MYTTTMHTPNTPLQPPNPSPPPPLPSDAIITPLSPFPLFSDVTSRAALSTTLGACFGGTFGLLSGLLCHLISKRTVTFDLFAAGGGTLCGMVVITSGTCRVWVWGMGCVHWYCNTSVYTSHLDCTWYLLQSTHAFSNYYYVMITMLHGLPLFYLRVLFLPALGSCSGWYPGWVDLLPMLSVCAACDEGG